MWWHTTSFLFFNIIYLFIYLSFFFLNIFLDNILCVWNRIMASFRGEFENLTRII